MDCTLYKLLYCNRQREQNVLLCDTRRKRHNAHRCCGGSPRWRVWRAAVGKLRCALSVAPRHARCGQAPSLHPRATRAPPATVTLSHNRCHLASAQHDSLPPTSTFGLRLLRSALPCMVEDSPDTIAALVLSKYAEQKFKPPDGQFTILAGFVLRSAESLKVISLGTGSKCLPASRLPHNGDALHDSHAEVLARRGAIRWFLEEIARSCSTSAATSTWIRRREDGKFALREGTTLIMYISTVPCEWISMTQKFQL